MPILVLDAWEHAYYLQYQNQKTDFFEAVWNVWNWEDVAAAFRRRPFSRRRARGRDEVRVTHRRPWGGVSGGKKKKKKIGALIVLSIFLRQKGSPQSKEVEAPHAETGA